MPDTPNTPKIIYNILSVDCVFWYAKGRNNKYFKHAFRTNADDHKIQNTEIMAYYPKKESDPRTAQVIVIKVEDFSDEMFTALNRMWCDNNIRDSPKLNDKFYRVLEFVMAEYTRTHGNRSHRYYGNRRSRSKLEQKYRNKLKNDAESKIQLESQIHSRTVKRMQVQQNMDIQTLQQKQKSQQPLSMQHNINEQQHQKSQQQLATSTLETKHNQKTPAPMTYLSATEQIVDLSDSDDDTAKQIIDEVGKVPHRVDIHRGKGLALTSFPRKKKKIKHHLLSSTSTSTNNHNSSTSTSRNKKLLLRNKKKKRKKSISFDIKNRKRRHPDDDEDDDDDDDDSSSDDDDDDDSSSDDDEDDDSSYNVDEDEKAWKGWIKKARRWKWFYSPGTSPLNLCANYDKYGLRVTGTDVNSAFDSFDNCKSGYVHVLIDEYGAQLRHLLSLPRDLFVYLIFRHERENKKLRWFHLSSMEYHLNHRQIKRDATTTFNIRSYLSEKLKSINDGKSRFILSKTTEKTIFFHVPCYITIADGEIQSFPLDYKELDKVSKNNYEQHRNHNLAVQLAAYVRVRNERNTKNCEYCSNPLIDYHNSDQCIFCVSSIKNSSSGPSKKRRRKNKKYRK